MQLLVINGILFIMASSALLPTSASRTLVIFHANNRPSSELHFGVIYQCQQAKDKIMSTELNVFRQTLLQTLSAVLYVYGSVCNFKSCQSANSLSVFDSLLHKEAFGLKYLNASFNVQ